MKLYRKPILGGAVSAYKILGDGKPSPVKRRSNHADDVKEDELTSEAATKIFERLLRSSRDLARQAGADR